MPAINPGLRTTSDANGNLYVAGPNGLINIQQRPPIKRPLPFLDVTDASVWTDLVGCTISVDNTVLFNGQPTLRIAVQPGVTTFRIGTSGMTALVPPGWDRRNVGVAIKASSTSLVTGWDLKLGNAGFTDFYNTAANTSHYGGTDGTSGSAEQTWVKPNEWWCSKAPYVSSADQLVVGANGSGAIALSTQMRLRLQFQGGAASAVTEYVWVGFVGVLPARKKPTLIIELDDGFKSHATFVRDLALHYDLPVSFAVNSSSLGTGNYMSVAQAKALYDHPSKLFDITNHGATHTAYDATTFAGQAAYNNAVAGRDALRAIGIGGDGPLHFVTPNSLWGNDLLNLLKQNGFLSCRNAGYSRVEDGKDQFIYVNEDKWQYSLNVCTQLRGVGALTAQRTLAQALTEIQQVITDNNVGFINGHDIQNTSGNYVWLKDDVAALLKAVADMRDAGTVDVKSKSRWFADAVGRDCDRR